MIHSYFSYYNFLSTTLAYISSLPSGKVMFYSSAIYANKSYVSIGAATAFYY